MCLYSGLMRNMRIHKMLWMTGLPFPAVNQMLVNGADSLNEKELSQFLLQQQPALSEAVCLKLADTIKEGDNVTIDRRALVIICLDKVSVPTRLLVICNG